MAQITYFVVQPFETTSRGQSRALEPLTATSAGRAKAMAERLAEQGGAIAFSRAGNEVTGQFDDAVILGTYGTVPEDAVELAAAAA